MALTPNDKYACSAHFIRTVVLKEIVLGELNKMVAFVKENEAEFIQAAMDNSVQKQSSELAKAKKKLKEAEKAHRRTGQTVHKAL